MPLRLKQLDLHGYKTFATKSEFVFSEGISAIVGPNGSGKSNIVDSIRWVLGEQSFGLLRGKKTEDMIFAGSELRPRAGMAEANLIFDNSDGWLPIDFSEVSIARRAYRDGENEYLLNGQRVRLRDISELLAKCGLSERTYTIIGQGLIDTALSLKAEERRALFEEAAGIGVYRNKREDALRKLDATQRNLERVLDILAELKPRLRSLERQAQRARDFNQVKADLHAILKLWYGYHWYSATEELERAQVVATEAAAELNSHQSKQEEYDQEVGAVRAKISDLKSHIANLKHNDARLQADLQTIIRELAVADERLNSLAAQRAALLVEIPQLQTSVTDSAQRAAEAQAEVTRLETEAAEARDQVARAQTAREERASQRAALHQRETESVAALARLDSHMTELRARQTQLGERSDRLITTKGEQLAALRQLETAEVAARQLVHDANANLDKVQAARAEAEVKVSAQAQAVRAAETHLAATTETAATARAELARRRARHEILTQARAELSGFAPGAKTLLAQNFATRGALAELLTVPQELETAISAALGAHLDALVINNFGEIDLATQLLGEANGRAALLPLEHLTAPEVLTAPDAPGVLGVAARLLPPSADPALARAVDLLLGRVVVVQDASVAQRLIQSTSDVGATHASPLPADTIFVTLNGEIFHASGPVFIGRDAAPTMLQQARERRDLSAEIETQTALCDQHEAEREAAARATDQARQTLVELQAALKTAQDFERRTTISRDSTALEAERVSHTAQFQREQVNALEADIVKVENETRRLKDELNQVYTERHAALEALEQAKAALATFSADDSAEGLAKWQTALAVAARAAQDAQTRAAELKRAQAAGETQLAERQGQVQRLEAQAAGVAEGVAQARTSEVNLREQINRLAAEIQPQEKELAAREAEQTRLETGDTQSRALLHAAEKRNQQAQLEFTRKQEEVDNMRRRIEEDFGLVEFDYGEAGSGPTPLPMYPLVEKLERLTTLPEDLEDQLVRKRAQWRRMGLINPEAEKEFNEVKERHDFLTTQVADLHAAQAQLREVIAEMDVLMERDFRKTFDAVANEFKETFARLFGGGTAKLLLTDPEHLTTSGVDIQARLPGRRPQSLSMLSGGERSLTACALVFALLRVSPTPFVVLDEVDAMLDEANVGRYRDMLKELAERTQFIVVTHNRNTVQVADTVYGITMGNDSASQVIGLKLDGEKVAGAPGPGELLKG